MAKRTFSFRASDELLGSFFRVCESKGLKPCVVCRQLVVRFVEEFGD